MKWLVMYSLWLTFLLAEKTIYVLPIYSYVSTKDEELCILSYSTTYLNCISFLTNSIIFMRMPNAPRINISFGHMSFLHISTASYKTCINKWLFDIIKEIFDNQTHSYFTNKEYLIIKLTATLQIKSIW